MTDGLAKRMEGITGSAIREIFKLLSKGDIISFGGGNPSADSFPTAEIKQITIDLLDTKPDIILQYGATEGYLPLRNAVCEHILPVKGVVATAENVLPLTGSMQGFDLLCRVIINEGDVVLVEAPSFLGVLQTLNIAGAKIIPVPSDSEGVMVDELEKLMKLHRPKLFYCIPTFQNPSGRTIGIARRKKIAELAAEYGVYVAEDDPYCDLRYKGESLPSIKSFDTANRVILFNSFSKIVSPGLRVGTLVAEPELLRKLVIAKQSADTHSPNLNQAIVAGFLNRGLLTPQLDRIRSLYSVRLDAMLNAMDKYFPKDCIYTKPDGGLFVWGELPGKRMTELVLRATEEYKVAFIPGQHFYNSPEGHEGTFRLNFSGTAFENIEIGIKRLGELFSE